MTTESQCGVITIGVAPFRATLRVRDFSFLLQDISLPYYNVLRSLRETIAVLCFTRLHVT